MNFSPWYAAAQYCEETYGVYVNWDEEWFLCPECGEPLYADDFEDWDWASCPICDFDFFDEEEEEF